MHARRLLDNLDLHSILTTLALGVIGVVAIASATVAQPSAAGLWRVQLLWLFLAAIAATVVIAVDYRVWAEFSIVLQRSNKF